MQFRKCVDPRLNNSEKNGRETATAASNIVAKCYPLEQGVMGSSPGFATLTLSLLIYCVTPCSSRVLSWVPCVRLECTSAQIEIRECRLNVGMRKIGIAWLTANRIIMEQRPTAKKKSMQLKFNNSV